MFVMLPTVTPIKIPIDSKDKNDKIRVYILW